MERGGNETAHPPPQKGGEIVKHRISLSRLMHNDKLMLVVSLVLAILVWALVVYGPSNAEDQVITGVPVSVTLNDYATQTLNLRVTEGGDSTATVRVHGLRSVVSKLTAADITVTADTGNVIREGTYTLPLRATSSGDYSIQSVVGTDGTNSTVTVTVDAWRESAFPVTVEIPNLTVVDEQTMQFGTPICSGAAMTDGKITVSGPRGTVGRIATVAAVVDDTAVIGEAQTFTGRLEARNEAGEVLKGVSFKNAEDGQIGVTVPVLSYRQVKLTPTLLHVPAGYQGQNDLITATPSTLEMWGVPSELDEYEQALQDKVQLDFDRLQPGQLTQEVALDAPEGIRVDGGVTAVKLQVRLSGVSSRKLDIAVGDANLRFTNVPAGYTVTGSQSVLTGVTLCGPSRVLSQIKASDVLVTVDATGISATGKQTVTARITVNGRDTVWAYYGDTKNGVDLVVSVSSG